MKRSKLLVAAAWIAAAPLAVLATGCQTTGASSKAPVYLIKVEKGDTLSSIAAKYDTTWDKIAELNGFKDGGELRAGRVIRVKPGPGGLVAGAEAAPAGARAAKKSRLSRAGEADGEAGADEFTEDDLPEDDSGTRGKKKGLLFGGDDRAELAWPVQGELSSHFGPRGGRQHQGIDIRAKHGTEITAAGTGVVEFAGRKSGYGKTVIVRHKRFTTLYAHMSDIEVDAGDRVDRSTVIGAVGATGNASGPHLHFEVRTTKGRILDPLSVLNETELLSSNTH